MSLNDQIQGMPKKGDRKFIFKEGVRYRHMTGKDPIVFRLLPSYDAQNQDASTSVLPFALPDGQLTDWGRVLYICRFIGHGKGGFGSRQDLLSLRSFASQGQEVFCPLEHLLKAISQMPQDWGYLTEDQGEQGAKYRERASFSRPTAHFIANIWDLNKPAVGVQIGCFTSSACNALVDGKTGLVFQRNNVPDEVIQQNYLLQYAVGDLTDPVKGPALICSKGDNNGEFSKYQVILALDGQNRVVTRPVGPDMLQQRYNMGAPDTFLNIPTEQDLVDGLVGLLNMRSPGGYHEYALLKQVFPQFRVPEPPAAPAASSTIPSAGFGGSPAAAAPGIPGMVAPQVSGPVSPAAGGIPGAPPSAGIPGTVPATPAAPVAPVVVPTAPVAAPVAPVAPVEDNLPGLGPAAPAAAPVAPAAPAPAAVPSAPASEASGAAANMAAAGGTPAPEAPAAATPAMPAAPAAPVAPGDDVAPAGGFNRADFLSRIETMGK
jgi:hypothetical protein